MPLSHLLPALALCVCGLVAAPVHAQTLHLALKTEIDSVDPHVAYGPNRAVLLNVYETLLRQDARMMTRPQLAEAWQQLDPLTWRFALRGGVRFHDGTPFTSDDVVVSLQRARRQGGPRTYAAALRAVLAIETDGPLGVILRTATPVANQPALLATIPMVSGRATLDAGADDWNGGRAGIGTGPYRLVRWTPGQGVALARNPAYWGGAEPWEDVAVRFVPSDPARMAALLAHEVDVADAVPAGLWDRLRGAGLQVEATDGILTAYLGLDTASPTMPAAGVPPPVSPPVSPPVDPPANPLRDPRVRQALSRAINRDALARQVMQTGATPAGQFMAPGLPGHEDALPPPPYDPREARRLLAEAGYLGGFDLPLGCAADRFAGDAALCQAVAQMLAAVGIRPRVELLPASVFLRRLYGSGAAGGARWLGTVSATGSPSGLVLEWMNTFLRSPAPGQGRGAGNPGFTSAAALDDMLDTAGMADTVEGQTAMVSAAARFAVARHLILPLVFLKASWGYRPDLVVEPRADGLTLAAGIRFKHP